MRQGLSKAASVYGALRSPGEYKSRDPTEVEHHHVIVVIIAAQQE